LFEQEDNFMLTFNPTHLASMAYTAWQWFEAADLRAVAILAVFALLFAAEALCGYRDNSPKTTRQSYLTNLGTFIMNDTLMSLMSVSALFQVAEHFGQWGLLQRVSDPLLKGLIAFLSFDLALYLWHRINHTFDWLWIFHKVHHSDPTMNVSTAFRLHFVEVVLTAVVKAAFIVAMGVDTAVVLASEAVITLMVMLHHANIRFPGEGWLAKLVIVPYLHRTHHSTLRKEHDNNYGAVFSFWDRLFGSFADKEPEKIGLESVPAMGVLELVRYGLSRKWLPSQQPVVTNRQLVQKMIAEAAYYRSKERGFAPGYDYIDWLEAEKEIAARLRREGKRKSPCSFLVLCR
jgi:sterol desaturase/sphingolipid hydroxylase (fatty acid hydroxylase superfamily)